ncbi:hypothetical protein BZA05DRAFT_88054 [Tricharina praecox]|uniref:uncharacterized protein n=1 Tax=Tricharina praecox TaxID=43433 RepID=UPI0022207124|nr:uncharacterized protein BZA05DRAFT_88054 [Tricharina praecox]KAI5848828.1 hypothetical protein BZA05DRAFT_88054 [Tricharina praecox]
MLPHLPLLLLPVLLFAAKATARCTTTTTPTITPTPTRPGCSDTICIISTNTGCGWVMGGCYLHSSCGGTYSTKECSTPGVSEVSSESSTTTTTTVTTTTPV